MALRMEWTVDDPIFASAGQCVRDEQEVVQWVDGSVIRIQDRMPPHAYTELNKAVQIMCARMLDEADSATSHAKQWSATVGPISVTLTPTR